MEPATIATSVITILSPYLKDVGAELLKTVGAVGVENAKSLFGWLKERFTGDPVATKDLSRFETDPEKFESGLQSTIEEKVRTDPGFAAELQKRIEEIGPQISVFQRIKDGKNVIGVDADAIRSGQTNVAQTADKVENLTGVRAKTIG